MKLLLIATNLREHSIGGGETFTLGLANALARRDDVTCQLVLGRRAAARVASLLSSRVEIIKTADRSGPARLIRDYFVLDHLVGSCSPDVVHYPHEWIPPLRYPTVATVQNVLWLTNGRAPLGPRFKSPINRIEGLTHRRLIRSTARRAAAVTAVSRIAADLWCATTGVDRQRLDVIAEGVDLPPLQSPNDHRYYLAVTGHSPHKNCRLLLDAYEKLCDDRPIPLWVAGIDGQSDERIRYLGWVNRPDLLGLMARAAATVYLSSVESFGLPAVESLCMGTRALVLRGTAMEEWLGDAVLSVEENTESVCDGLRRIVTAGRVGASELAAIRQRFAWDAIAQQYVDVYRRALSVVDATVGPSPKRKALRR